jgi:hypothetical protein
MSEETTASRRQVRLMWCHASRAACFASDHASFVHGATLSVDGGLVVGT